MIEVAYAQRVAHYVLRCAVVTALDGLMSGESIWLLVIEVEKFVGDVTDHLGDRTSGHVARAGQVACTLLEPSPIHHWSLSGSPRPEPETTATMRIPFSILGLRRLGASNSP